MRKYESVKDALGIAVFSPGAVIVGDAIAAMLSVTCAKALVA